MKNFASVGAEDGFDFGGGPEVVETFLAIDFGVEGGVEGAGFGAHLGFDEIEDVLGDGRVARFIRLAEGLGVDPGEHRVCHKAWLILSKKWGTSHFSSVE